MRIAVTGASGFVGGQIALALAADGHDVHAYGQRARAALVCDLPNYASWNLLAGPVARPRVDVVVHCAALVGDWGPEARYRSVNVDGTRTVLESFGSKTRVVMVSTSSVYSDQVPKSNIREDAHVGACSYSAYGRTKAQAEALALSLRPDALILRPHIVYGPGDTTLLPRVLAARRFGMLAVPGTGHNRLSVTHVRNLADAVALAIRHEDASGAFNVTDGETTSLDELLRVLLARAGAPTRIVYIPRSIAWRVAAALESVWPSDRVPRGPLLTRFVVAQLADEHTLDISRARAILEYAPRFSYRTDAYAPGAQ